MPCSLQGGGCARLAEADLWARNYRATEAATVDIDATT